ncbi:MAG TPA: HisA/HisF-related TIM barrel protein, partial [Planctomycetaceae bacterium]|nr:HisA/HisF-related TIM barrel protein [Planctomycetaceae bacterium]
ARAFRSQLALSTLYVADLDAILDGRPNWDVYRDLAGAGFELWVDAGLRDGDRAEKLLAAGAAAVIAGLETCSGPQLLAALCERFGAPRILFSLDLQSGHPLGELTDWGTDDPHEIASRAVDAGIRRLIVLDLAHVGGNSGLATAEFCRRLRARHPELELITGGGLRDAGDLAELSRSGVDGVLVASALHDGRLTRQDLEACTKNSGPIEAIPPGKPRPTGSGSPFCPPPCT